MDVVDLETLKTLALQGTAVNMVAVSCLTCILYDHLMTLGEEIKMMWSLKFSLARVLFFLNRYLVEGLLLFNCISATRANLGPPLFLCLLSAVASNHINTFQLNHSRYLGTATLGVVLAFVFARLPFLSDHYMEHIDRSNTITLCIVFFFYAGGVITLSGLTIRDYVGEDVIINDSLTSLPGCYAKTIPAIIAGYWIAPVCVESVLFALVFSKIFYWWRTGISPPPLIAVIVRDSMIYFSVIFAFLIANLFMFYFGPPFIAGSLLVTPSAAAGCVLGSHMLLNLRSAALQEWMPAHLSRQLAV